MNLLMNVNETNITDNNNKYSNSQPEWNNLLLGSVLIAISLTTIFGNLLVICAVKRERALKTATNYYIISLAVADLLVGLVVMPFNSLNEMTNNYWFFGQVMCDLWHSLDVFASTASILSLLMIALDRHSAISDPINYPTRWLNCNWMLFVAGIWICSAFISFPAIAYWRHLKTEFIPNQCIFTDDVYYLIFSSFVSFYIPLTLMIIVYIRIYRAATKQVNAIKTGQKLNVKGTDGQALTLRIHRGGYRGINTQTKDTNKNVSTNTHNSTSCLHTKSYSFKKGYSLIDLNQQKSNQLSKLKSKSMPNLKHFNRIEIIKYTQSNITEKSINHLITSKRSSNNLHSYSLANSIYTPNNNLSSSNNKLLNNSKINKNYDEFRETIEFYQQHYADHQMKPTINKTNKVKCSNCVSKAFSCDKKLNENCCIEFKRALVTKINSLSLTRKMSKFSREQKAAKTLGIVMGVFIVCWLPFFIYQILLAIGILNKPNNLLFTIFTWFGYANSGCNPIIYAFSSRDFRRAFLKILFSSKLAKLVRNKFSNKNNANKNKKPNSQLKKKVSLSNSTKNSITQCQVCDLYKQIILANNVTNLNRKAILMLINEKNKYLETNVSSNKKNQSTSSSIIMRKNDSKISESIQQLNKKAPNSSISLTQSLRRRLQIMFNNSSTNTNVKNSTANRRLRQLVRSSSIDSVSSGVSLALIKSKPSSSNFNKEYKFDRQKSKLILMNDKQQQQLPKVQIRTRFSFVKENENLKLPLSTNLNDMSNCDLDKRNFKQIYSFKQQPNCLVKEQLSITSSTKNQFWSFDDEAFTDHIYND